MLTKLTHTISFSLLSLFPALFIAAGMPLLHPTLHSHSENHHIISDCGHAHFSEFAGECDESNCPICDFLATSQLFDSSLSLTLAEIEPGGKNISIKKALTQKTYPLHTEPRAPPMFASL